MLAECLAAELCLRIGRAAASHAERCATALSEAQAAAREVSQLLHRASLAELDLMPGRITCYLANSAVTDNNGANKIQRQSEMQEQSAAVTCAVHHGVTRATACTGVSIHLISSNA